MNSKWFPWLLAKYVVLLGFAIWLAWKKSAEARQHVERLAETDVAFARAVSKGNLRWTLLPMLAAAILVGSISSLVKHDARWFLVTGFFMGLLAVGEGLRWLVYERWVTSQLRRHELLSYRRQA